LPRKSPQKRALKLREIGRTRPKEDELVQVFQDLANGSDRAAALIAAAEVDNALEDAIASEWTNMEPDDRELIFSPLGPLSGLAMKVRVAHAMGIFGAITKRDLEKIAHMRNGFAHSSRPWSFDHEPIHSECLSLQVLKSYSVRELGRLPNLYEEPRNARGMFTDTCLAVVTVLRRHTIRHEEAFLAFMEGMMAPLDAGEVTGEQMNTALRHANRIHPP
jgi:hypothetical protein